VLITLLVSYERRVSCLSRSRREEEKKEKTHLSLIGVCFCFVQSIISPAFSPGGGWILYRSSNKSISSSPEVKDRKVRTKAWKNAVSDYQLFPSFLHVHESHSPRVKVKRERHTGRSMRSQSSHQSPQCTSLHTPFIIKYNFTRIIIFPQVPWCFWHRDHRWERCWDRLNVGRKIVDRHMGE